jgi:hypothetical protein
MLAIIAIPCWGFLCLGSDNGRDSGGLTYPGRPGPQIT